MRVKRKLGAIILTAFVFVINSDLAFSIKEIHEHDVQEHLEKEEDIQDEHAILLRTVELKDGAKLSILDCVSLAFQNSPKIKRKKYELDVAKSHVGIAKSQYFPIFNAGVGLNFQTNSDGIYYDRRYRDLPAVGVSLNQLIWNFGKSTAFIKMEKFYKIAAEYEFMDALCYTLFDTKAKYYNLLKAKALYNIAKNNLEINENFLKLSKGKTPADISTAELNLSEAKIKFIEAENTLNNAKYDLSNVMYLDTQPNYDIENTQTFTYNDKYSYESKQVEVIPFEAYVFPFEIKDAQEIAYKNSPDLQVLIATKNAMEQSLKYVKRSFFPNLTADVGYGYNNSSYTGENSHNHGLAVGVNLATSVNFMELRHGIKGARAEVNLAENEISLFKKDLYYELQRAFNNVDRAKKQVPTAKKEVEQAHNNLKIVEERYRTNRLNYVALQDARKDYIRSLDSYVDSVYNYNIALIQVEMAMHYHLVDIHHKSEHAMHYHSNDLIEDLIKALDCNGKEVTSKNRKKLKKNRKPSL